MCGEAGGTGGLYACAKSSENCANGHFSIVNILRPHSKSTEMKRNLSIDFSGLSAQS